uniref:Thioredoxin n=1 Tax=Candidatus Kentrum sp. LPFa TaxID=2126335 RepID=A0A450XG00_9GAMM|nr:MAG: Thioredoxin [Candidatus Kentron sp. LPFa]VFK28220.1 MAG: Thioredoxin [Candidatus Kentron sp. LPFa]
MKTPHKKSSNALFGIALALMLGATQTLAADRVLFQLNGADYDQSKLSQGSRLALFAAESKYYRELQQVIDKELFEIYLVEEAKRMGKSKEAIRAERLTVAEPTEKEIRAFYDSRKARMKKPYEAVREGFTKYLRKKAVSERKAALVAAYREKNAVKMLMSRPVAPVMEIATEGFPVKGDPKAPVTIVEFADYKCGYCKKASKAIERVMVRFEGKVKVVYMDRPILGSASKAMAQGGVCADKQGKFWAWHDLAYKNQKSLTEESSAALAREIGLDGKAFGVCLESEATIARIGKSEKEAERLQLTSVPSIFVNGKWIISRDLERDLIRAVEEALAE